MKKALYLLIAGAILSGVAAYAAAATHPMIRVVQLTR
jgi:hypothetical protein